MEVICQLHAPAALLMGKQPPVPVVEVAEWAPESSARYAKEKNLCPYR
jgi:hypothetical protein